jgi:hypothetical protein
MNPAGVLVVKRSDGRDAAGRITILVACARSAASTSEHVTLRTTVHGAWTDRGSVGF